MMLESPKSLTATVHVRFHYTEPEAKPMSDSQTQMIGKILDQAAEMEPEFQELLLKFTDYLNQQKQKTEG